MPPLPPDDDDDRIDLDELAENMSLDDLLKDPESDLLPQVKPLLQDAYLDAMARARLAKDDAERKPHEDQANAIEGLLKDEAIWEWGSDADLPEDAVALVREPKPELADELDRRRQVREGERVAQQAREAEQTRLDALDDQERAAQLASAQETAQFEQQRRDFEDWMNDLVEKGELVRAVHPLKNTVELVPPDGRTPPSLRPVVDLFHQWHELPIHDRENWWAQRTQAEKDALSVMYQVHEPVGINQIPALRENQP
jgi:hypothetical protein